VKPGGFEWPPPGPTGLPLPDVLWYPVVAHCATAASHRNRARAPSALGADDIRGDVAELGYVNRSLPDAELDEFVDALATRIAS
jgi:hypothetical protein